MALTPEGRIKEQVKKLFKRFKCYYHMPVMNGMGAPTLDFIACCFGRFVGVETKAPGKHATPRQQITMHDMALAGGYVFEVSNDASLARLEFYLEMFEAGASSDAIAATAAMLEPQACTLPRKKKSPLPSPEATSSTTIGPSSGRWRDSTTALRSDGS
jgi:hypothetical protein